MRDVDLVVIGAGPAGATAALAARVADPGARIVLLDRADFPRDKACGDGVAPQALDELVALGADRVADGFPPIGRLALRGPGGAMVDRPLARADRVIPRVVFDARIVQAAQAAGAELLRHRVRDLRHDTDGVVVDGRWRAPVVVAADGANSVVRRLLGLRPPPPASVAVALRAYADWDGALTQTITMTRRSWPAYAWVFPTGTGTANVGFGTFRDRLDGGGRQLHDGLRRLLPDVEADPASVKVHPLPTTLTRMPLSVGPVLLAGDAAGLINPLTGEGIYYAVASGARAGLAAVTARNPAAAYRRALARLLGSHLRQTRMLADATRRAPTVVDAALAAGAGRQAAFDELVETGLAAGVLGPGTVMRVLGAALVNGSTARRRGGR